jgi:hypothetical protein
MLSSAKSFTQSNTVDSLPLQLKYLWIHNTDTVYRIFCIFCLLHNVSVLELALLHLTTASRRALGPPSLLSNGYQRLFPWR